MKIWIDLGVSKIMSSFPGARPRRLRQSENDHCRRPRRRPPETRRAARSGRDVLFAVDRVSHHATVHCPAGVESVKNLARAGVECQKISGHLSGEEDRKSTRLNSSHL